MTPTLLMETLTLTDAEGARREKHREQGRLKFRNFVR